MAKNQVTMLPPGNKPAPGMPKKHRVSGASLDAKKAWIPKCLVPNCINLAMAPAI